MGVIVAQAVQKGNPWPGLKHLLRRVFFLCQEMRFQIWGKIMMRENYLTGTMGGCGGAVIGCRERSVGAVSIPRDLETVTTKRLPGVQGGTPMNAQTLLAGLGLAVGGYHVVVQDTRGRFESEGTFSPYGGEDGAATAAWLASRGSTASQAHGAPATRATSSGHWRRRDHSAAAARLAAPVHLIGGWHDFLLRSTLSSYHALWRLVPTPSSQLPHRR